MMGSGAAPPVPAQEAAHRREGRPSTHDDTWAFVHRLSVLAHASLPAHLPPTQMPVQRREQDHPLLP